MLKSEPELLTSEQRKRIGLAITKQGATLPCPRCGNDSFSVADGHFFLSVTNDTSSVSLGGPGIPCVGIICKKCGFLSLHHAGPLGLVETAGDKK